MNPNKTLIGAAVAAVFSVTASSAMASSSLSAEEPAEPAPSGCTAKIMPTFDFDGGIDLFAKKIVAVSGCQVSLAGTSSVRLSLHYKSAASIQQILKDAGVQIGQGVGVMILNNKVMFLFVASAAEAPPAAPREVTSTTVTQARPRPSTRAPVDNRASAELYIQAPVRNTITPSATATAAESWGETGTAITMIGDDGEVMYAYGASRPIVTCAPLHICLIKLLPGEKVSNLSIGDTVRWKVQAATAGKYPIVVVKPTLPGIATNLSIMTDAGRVYYLTLRSDKRGQYVPEIAFYDPQQMVERVAQQESDQAAAGAAAMARNKAATVATLPGIDPATLDFDYKVKADEGATSPVRVFSSAGHTYIQMPPDLSYSDAPAIFAITNNEQQLANFRLVGAYYVIDGIPAEIKLVLGAGSHAQTVDIKHKDKSHSFWN